MVAKEETKEVDIWRDTPIRLLGYANEIGESFRYIFPAAYKPSYILASGYCMCDVLDKGYKTYRDQGFVLRKNIFVNSFDAMVWQFLASVFVPGFLINRTVEFSTYTLTKMHAANLFKS